MSTSRLEEAKAIAARWKYIKHLYLRPKGFTPGYLRYRLIRPLLKLYIAWLIPDAKKKPWTSPASIAIFDALLTSDMIGLEYGSGRSTTYFARRLQFLHTVEHHAGWYEQVQQILQAEGLQNIDYQHIARQEEDQLPLPAFYAEYQLDPDTFAYRKDYRTYFERINQLDDNYLDFALIDGRARTECVLCVRAKLKPGGILALDNSERDRYSLARQLLANWPSVTTTNGITNTTIWFKPSEE